MVRGATESQERRQAPPPPAAPSDETHLRMALAHGALLIEMLEQSNELVRVPASIGVVSTDQVPPLATAPLAHLAVIRHLPTPSPQGTDGLDVGHVYVDPTTSG